MPLSIRATVTTWFFVLVAALLIVFSVTLYLLIRDSLLDVLDADLRAQAETMAGRCEWEDDVDGIEFEMAEMAAPPSGTVPTGILVLALPDRRVLHVDPPADGPRLLARVEGVPGPKPLPPEGAIAAITEPGRGASRAALLLSPLIPAEDSGNRTVPDGLGVLVLVEGSAVPVLARLDRIRVLIAGLAALSLLATAGFGALLSRRVVRPLRALGDAARRATAGSPAKMPTRGTGDEVDRLAAILDGSFSSLHGALESQRRFTADASHELRNPTAVIVAAAEVALRRERPPEEYASALEDILGTSRRMAETLEALLLLSRLDAGTTPLAREPVDLGDLASDVIAGVGPEERARIRVGGDPAARVDGDPRLLRVLIHNLVRNALRHGGTDVPVVVSVERAHGEGVTLRVSDRGCGIPRKHRPRVFERFFRGPEGTPEDGAGLGLSIVAAVAAAHGASCRLEDRDGPGTTVAVDFPTVRLPGTLPNSAPRCPRGTSSSGPG